MTVTLHLTRLPLHNNSIVIKQTGGRFFIAAENSLIIDKDGLLQLILELGKMDFIDMMDVMDLEDKLAEFYVDEMEKGIKDAAS